MIEQFIINVDVKYILMQFLGFATNYDLDDTFWHFHTNTLCYVWPLSLSNVSSYIL